MPSSGVTSYIPPCFSDKLCYSKTSFRFIIIVGSFMISSSLISALLPSLSLSLSFIKLQYIPGPYVWCRVSRTLTFSDSESGQSFSSSIKSSLSSLSCFFISSFYWISSGSVTWRSENCFFGDGASDCLLD